jgi:hypothetical protein
LAASQQVSLPSTLLGVWINRLFVQPAPYYASTILSCAHSLLLMYMFRGIAKPSSKVVLNIVMFVVISLFTVFIIFDISEISGLLFYRHMMTLTVISLIIQATTALSLKAALPKAGGGS